jgi:hypothetical protein
MFKMFFRWLYEQKETLTVKNRCICTLGFMWCKKDITSIYASVSVEDALPIIITTIGVALLKTLSLAAIIILIKWLISKFLNTRKGNSYE